jgi:multisubunit Na+/H+ antiporter MnhG subunit
VSAATLSQWVLVWVGVAIELGCAAGLVLARGAFDRLHYAAAAGPAGAAPIVAAVVVRESFTQPAVNAIVIGLMLALLGPLLSIATLRALRIDRFGQVEARKEERA